MAKAVLHCPFLPSGWQRKRLSGQKTKHPLVLVGVEPVAGTIDLIRKAAEAAGLYKDPMIKTHLVQAGCGEVRTKVSGLLQCQRIKVAAQTTADRLFRNQ